MLNSWTVRTLCGPDAYKIGKEYYRLGLITELEKTDVNRYSAAVDGRERYSVSVDLREEDMPEARCECPAFHTHFRYCSHIAAVLIQLIAEDGQRPKHGEEDMAMGSASPTMDPAESRRHERVATQLIDLFGGGQSAASGGKTRAAGLAAPPIYTTDERKEMLGAEFTCHLEEGLYSSGNSRFAVSVKIGPGRLYTVRDIRQFLEHVDQNKPLPFSKGFTYDPLHRFKEQDNDVLKQLVSIYASERVYEASGHMFSRPSGKSSFTGKSRSSALQKQLLIPPLAWDRLADSLAAAGAVMELPGGFTAEMQLTDKRPPIDFQLKKQGTQRCLLVASGLGETVLMPAYDCAVFRGNVYRMSAARLGMLKEFKNAMDRAGLEEEEGLEIPDRQIDAFIEKVVPKLRTLGTVSIDRSIESRIIQPKLAAKLFLDRLDDTLYIRLEFHYDGIVIFPLRREQRQTIHEDSILLRDTEQEARVLSAVARLGLAEQGDEWITAEEEAIYEVLFRLLPSLENEAEVYATQAVRDWVHTGKDTFQTLIDADASMNWLEISFSMDGVDEKEIRRILLAVIERKNYYRLPDGAFLSLEEDGFAGFAGLYHDLGLRKSDLAGSARVPLVRALYLDGTYRDGVRQGKALSRFLEQIRDPERLELDVPPSLADVMRDYQKRGYRWLKMLAKYRFGGILADDMGLGKTLQTIAFLLSERLDEERLPEVERLPGLIVTPASLIYNWENEFAKFAPELKVKVVAGSKDERMNELTADLSDTDVIITSYPLLRRDTDIYASLRFGSMILDEAQAFKNHATQTAQAVKEIVAGRRFALTGTPIENSLDELWSIMDAVFPELFTGRKAFKEMSRDKLSRAVSPFILRRMKSEVLRELPEKIETVTRSELTLEQKKLYAVYLSKLQKKTEEDLETAGFQKSRLKILAGITRLRQLCCHPGLFIDNYQGSSGKLEQLMEIVNECMSGGKRMLIFSQFTGMLELIRRELTGHGLSSFYLDGQTAARERVDMCARFNQGEKDIFLISLKAGGTGLNLTGADTVVLYDLWWNPAVEDQAAGRAHRLGQKKSVQVIRLTAKGTIEDKMLELQQRKKDLIRDVLGAAEADKSIWSEQDIRELLMIPKSM
ncbi:DEAD/DEAH box helicase [Paenibacillus caui]|uniref:DEAD/DEAH box helicase n=1 Tax=Paenibacillus caui TaxID=2873927 RepID=UPI001CA7D832|nr:DEAD/DEAH box helicase [Paenibacillus caui]